MSFKSYILPFAESAFLTPEVRVILTNTTNPLFNQTLNDLGGIKQAASLSHQDRWRNPRVPFIHMLPEYREDDPFAWVDVDNNTIPPYSSLIGIPIRGFPKTGLGNATLAVQSSYTSVSVSKYLVRRSANIY